MSSKIETNKKYEKVMSYVQDNILTNNLKEGDKLPTEKELAFKYNVSRITVQRALRELQQLGIIYCVQGAGSYVGTNKEYKKEDITFMPIIASRSNINNRFIEVIQGAEKFLSKYSCFVTIHSPNNPEEEQEIILSLINKRAQCFIVLPYEADKNIDFYENLLLKKFPIVFVDFLPFKFTGNLVTSDNTSGGYLATKHLLDQGYRRIAFISSNMHPEPSINERKNGYQYALKEAGIPFNPNYLSKATEQFDDTVKRIRTLPEPPDAIFCVNDITAVGVYSILQRDNVQIPEDIALIGFDDLEISAKQPIPISTIRQDFFEMGYSAAEIAVKLIKEKPVYYTQHVLPVSLIPRESTQKAKRVNL